MDGSGQWLVDLLFCLECLYHYFQLMLLRYDKHNVQWVTQRRCHLMHVSLLYSEVLFEMITVWSQFLTSCSPRLRWLLVLHEYSNLQLHVAGIYTWDIFLYKHQPEEFQTSSRIISHIWKLEVIPSLKLTARPCKYGFPKGNSSSSNHPFSGAMLVSGRVFQLVHHLIAKTL